MVMRLDIFFLRHDYDMGATEKNHWVVRPAKASGIPAARARFDPVSDIDRDCQWCKKEGRPFESVLFKTLYLQKMLLKRENKLRHDQAVAEIRLGRGAFPLTFLCVNRIGNRAEKEKSNTSGNRRIVRKRKNGCASGLENSRDLRNSTVKTVQTVKHIGAGNVIKRIIVERDLLIKIARQDFLSGNLTQVRLNITAGNVVAEFLKTKCEGSFSAACIKELGRCISSKYLYYFIVMIFGSDRSRRL